MILDGIRRRVTARFLCHAVFVATALALTAGDARAQAQRPELMDSTHVDTTAAPRPAADTARVPIARPIGAPLGTVLPGDADVDAAIVSKRDLVHYRYFTLFDVLRQSLPAYPLSQGAPGSVRAFSFAGGPSGDVSFSYNGRPLPSADAQGYDPELYPTEFMERAEILTGARAVVHGAGESTVAVNLVQPRFAVDGSYVRLWYIQGPYNTTGADILFDRNIGRTGNLSLGFRRIPSDGEMPNQKISNTAIHGALTWNPSNDLSLSLTEIYGSGTRGLNGGLTPTSSLTRSLMEVYDTRLGEHELRHDVTLSARWLPGVRRDARTSPRPALEGGKGDSTRSDSASPNAPLDPARRDSAGRRAPGPSVDLGDTVTRFDADLYYTHAERSLVYGETLAVIDGAERSALLDQFGGRVAMILPLPFATFEASARGELTNGAFGLEAGGMLDLHTGTTSDGRSLVSLRPAVKLLSDGSTTSVIALGEGAFSLGPLVGLRASIRQTIRVTEPQADCVEPPLDATHYFRQDRTAFLAEAGAELGLDSFRVSALGFLRRTTPTLCSPFPETTFTGADLRLQVPYRFLTLKLRGLVSLPPEGDLRFPKILADGDLYADLTLFRGNLNLRVGTTVEFQSSFAGAEYDALSDDFIYPSDPVRLTTSGRPYWSAYAVARIGSAYLRAEMRNILDVEYWTLYRYPAWSRALYLSATWSLFD